MYTHQKPRAMETKNKKESLTRKFLCFLLMLCSSVAFPAVQPILLSVEEDPGNMPYFILGLFAVVFFIMSILRHFDSKNKSKQNSNMNSKRISKASSN